MVSRGNLLSVAVLLVILSLTHSTAAQGADEGGRQTSSTGGSWLCANWIPQGFQTNMCRVFCFVFMNRVPTGNTTGCTNGSCDCS